jgi:hypothetical protein
MTELLPKEGKKVRLVFDVPESITSRYATHMTVQRTDQEFIVSFFELELPAIFGSPEERAEQWKHVTEAHAKCVARVVVAPARMQQFADVVRESLSQLHREGKADEY